MNVNLPVELAPLVLLLSFAWLLVNVAFAFAIGYDAGNLPEGRNPIFVGKWVWFFTVLIGGPFFAVAYWAMHHSMLSPFVYRSFTREHD